MVLGIATLMIACKSKSTDNTKVLGASNEAEYAAFVQWKEAKAAEVKNSPAAAPAVRTVEKTVVVNQAPAAASPAVATRKKGWSKAAKATVIGAGAGAVAGAVINKRNPAAGAVIGGILGAGAGYGIGRSMDKKDGRY